MAPADHLLQGPSTLGQTGTVSNPMALWSGGPVGVASKGGQGCYSVWF